MSRRVVAATVVAVVLGASPAAFAKAKECNSAGRPVSGTVHEAHEAAEDNNLPGAGQLHELDQELCRRGA